MISFAIITVARVMSDLTTGHSQPFEQDSEQWSMDRSTVASLTLPLITNKYVATTVQCRYRRLTFSQSVSQTDRQTDSYVSHWQGQLPNTDWAELSPLPYRFETTLAYREICNIFIYQCIHMRCACMYALTCKFRLINFVAILRMTGFITITGTIRLGYIVCYCHQTTDPCQHNPTLVFSFRIKPAPA